MKNLMCLSVLVLFAVVPSYGGPTIRMTNDSSPAYTMEILEDGFGGMATGTQISTFCVDVRFELQYVGACCRFAPLWCIARGNPVRIRG